MTKVKEICDLIVNRQEPLDLSRRFESLHDLLASPRRLMGILGSIVQPLMLAMLDTQAHVFARRAIRFELVGDHDARRPRRLLEKFAHEPPSLFGSEPERREQNRPGRQHAIASASNRGS